MKKTKTLKKIGVDHQELNTILGQMIGEEDPDIAIVETKYSEIFNSAQKIVDSFKFMFIANNAFSGELLNDFRKAINDILTFCTNSSTELRDLSLTNNENTISGKRLVQFNSSPSTTSNDLIFECLNGHSKKELIDKYKKLKNCATITNIIIASAHLRNIVDEDKKDNKKEFHDLKSKDNLSDSFITKSKDDHMELLPQITVLDFRQLWLYDIEDNLKKNILHTLYILLFESDIIIRNIMSPDVDVEKLADVLIKAISVLKTRIQRCDQAFNKIQDSVELFKKNFPGYYKGFVTSGDKTSIITSFITDVADNSSKASPMLTFQFKRIISAYSKELSSQRQADPRVQMLLGALNQNIKEMEKMTGKQYEELGKEENAEVKKYPNVGKKINEKQNEDFGEEENVKVKENFVDDDKKKVKKRRRRKKHKNENLKSDNII